MVLDHVVAPVRLTSNGRSWAFHPRSLHRCTRGSCHRKNGSPCCSGAPSAVSATSTKESSPRASTIRTRVSPVGCAGVLRSCRRAGSGSCRGSRMASPPMPADDRDPPASARLPGWLAEEWAKLCCKVAGEGSTRAGGPQTIPCPCGYGVVFQDARGGYECTACDTRFHIYRDPPHAYGGPQGPLTLLEQLRSVLGLWLLPKHSSAKLAAQQDTSTCPICKAGPREDCDAELHS
jgi:hypothetical protein